MSNLFKQSMALAHANFKSLPRRMWISVSMVFSIAMVVTVLLGFLAMENGFRQSLQQTGAPDIAIVLGTGAASEQGSQIERSQINFLTGFPGIKTTQQGVQIISQELVVPVDAIEVSSGLPATLSLRGIGGFGLETRPTVQITEGRAFQAGAPELIVGRSVASNYADLTLGKTVRFGTANWTVVGIFDAGGSVFESEIYGDSTVVRSLFNRPGLVQSMRIKMTTPDEVSALADFAKNNVQIALPVKSEKDYFSGLGERTSKLILLLGWPLAIMMAAGAVIGAMTTIYSSVSDRAVEIATVRTLGFSRRAAFFGTWIEALFLTSIGCIVGVAFVYFAMDGLGASTTGADQTQIGFKLDLTWPLVQQAVWLALIVGAIGGGLPALNATKIPLRIAMTGRG